MQYNYIIIAFRMMMASLWSVRFFIRIAMFAIEYKKKKQHNDTMASLRMKKRGEKNKFNVNVRRHRRRLASASA